MPQYPLKFDSPPDFSRENFFVSDSNREALEYIELWPDWPQHCLVLCGPRQSGKSHLAKIWQEKSGKKNVVVEDINLIHGREQEEALFHLYNRTREEGQFLLLTSAEVPSAIAWQVPDLASRLKGSLLVRVNEPDDGLLRTLMLKQFSDRQLRVSTDVLDYLLLRIGRSCHAVAELVERLDKISLEERRNITVPLARKVLEGN